MALAMSVGGLVQDWQLEDTGRDDDMSSCLPDDSAIVGLGC